VPIKNQRDKKSQTPGEKDDAASEPEGIIVRQALHDEEDGTHQE